MFKAVIVLLAVLLPLSLTHELKPISLDRSQWGSLQPLDFATKIANEQPQILRKIVNHYLTEQISDMSRRMSNIKIKEEMYDWFQTRNIEDLSEKLSRFMRQKLFSKLEMEKLSNSFKEEIEKNPEIYFLTYEMYDLLID